jgi:RimJ/RimL family protein N-acetyltransferase
MIISRHAVRLVRIGQEHLELIRYWRNSEKIRSVMEYREFITRPMQLKWFRSLSSLCDFYFIIEYKEQYIGLIHVARIDWKHKTAQSGLFVWDDAYIGTPVPVIASLNLLDTCYNWFGLEKIEAKVKHDNFVAISYNRFLGFEEVYSAEKKEFIQIFLTKEKYNRVVEDIRQHIDNDPDNSLNIFIAAEQFGQLRQAGIPLSENITGGNIILE